MDDRAATDPAADPVQWFQTQAQHLPIRVATFMATGREVTVGTGVVLLMLIVLERCSVRGGLLVARASRMYESVGKRQGASLAGGFGG